MAFPEFETGKRRLLFFSRGRGRGHAIPDVEIARRLPDDIDVRFVSYGRGARTIEQFGYPLLDIDLPEHNGTAETTVLAGKLIGWLRPELVVSHEEFAALPAAAIFDIPALFLTGWFTDPEKFSMQSLRFAERILFLGARGHFPEPPTARGKTNYIGPVVRDFTVSRKDKQDCRAALVLPHDTIVIAVLPGSWSEQQAPIADLVLNACKDHYVVWLAGEDRNRIPRRPNVTVLDYVWNIETVMAASDLAITKGSRSTANELAALGIRSLTITHGLNEMDDRLAPHALDATSLTPVKLKRAIQQALAEPAPRPQRFTGAAKAALAIAKRIEACTPRP